MSEIVKPRIFIITEVVNISGKINQKRINEDIVTGIQ